MLGDDVPKRSWRAPLIVPGNYKLLSIVLQTLEMIQQKTKCASIDE